MSSAIIFHSFCLSKVHFYARWKSKMTNNRTSVLSSAIQITENHFHCTASEMMALLIEWLIDVSFYHYFEVYFLPLVNGKTNKSVRKVRIVSFIIISLAVTYIYVQSMEDNFGALILTQNKFFLYLALVIILLWNLTSRRVVWVKNFIFQINTLFFKAQVVVQFVLLLVL